MPPDHEDLNRRLEALQRYVTDLTEERRRAREAAPGPRRPSARWLLAAGLLVAVALVGGLLVGAVAWSDDRPAGGDTGVAGTASSRRNAEAAAVTPTATLECKTAVDRANAMLASAVKLRGALAEHDRILNDPSNRDLSVGQVLQKLAVTQQAGASESARFDQDLDAYRQVVDRCDLRVP